MSIQPLLLPGMCRCCYAVCPSYQLQHQPRCKNVIFVLSMRFTSFDHRCSPQIGRQQRKPTGGELELAFYNAAAASSPLTQGLKFVKGLTGGGGKH